MEFIKAPAPKINSYSNKPVIVHMTVGSEDKELTGKIVYKALKGNVVLESETFKVNPNKQISIAIAGFESIPKPIKALHACIVVCNSLGEKLVAKVKLVLSRTNKSLFWLGFSTYFSHGVYTRIPDHSWEDTLAELPTPV